MNDFLLNDVVVRPRLNEIQIDGYIEKLPAKFIDVLMVLAERQGEVFGKAELLKRVWNDPLIGEESLSNAVWMLRKTLSDDAKRPAFIETVPRRGYRLIARVAPVRVVAEVDTNEAPAAEPVASLALETAITSSAPAGPDLTSSLVSAPPVHAWRHWLAMTLLLLLMLGLGYGWWSKTQHAAPGNAVMAFRTSGDVATMRLLDAGTALIAERAGQLYAVDTTSGIERWRFNAGGRIQIPAEVADAKLFLGSEDTYLYALDYASGRELWRFPAGHSIQTAPLARDGRVFFADISGRLQALSSSDAAPIWQAQLDSRVVGSLLGPLDLTVLRTLNNTVAAFDRSSGAMRWQRHFPGPLSDLLLVAQTEVMFASDAGFVTALNAQDGASLWQTELPAAEIKPLVVGDRVYALGRYGDLVALRRADGSVVWRAHMDIGDPHELVWWQDQIVLVLDGGLLGLVDPTDGSLLRTLSLPETPDGVLADGLRLIVSTQSGRVIAIDRGELDGFQAAHLAVDEAARLHIDGPAPAPMASVEVLQKGASAAQLLWQQPLVGHVQDVAVARDGTVYLSDERSALAIAADGQRRWYTPLPTAMGTQFALTETKVYFGRRDGSVYALERASGKEVWRFATAAQVISPPTVADGRVYVGSDDRRLYALDAETGKVLWSFQTQRPVRGAVAVGLNRVVFGSADRNIYALTADSGRLLWKFVGNDWMVAHPLLVGRRVFIGSGSGEFHALDLESGSELWRFRSAGKIWFRATADNECVYFASGDGHIYALDQATGMERWRYRTGAAADGSVVLADGRLYAGSHDFHLYALDRSSGQPLWRMRTGGSVFNPGVGNGLLYVASADQRLYALKL